MRDRHVGRYALLLCSCALLLAACAGGGSSADSTPAALLQGQVAADWNRYRQTYGVPGGGMAVYLETPRGNYFASSGMPAGVDQNTHFRIASNTKTFTSAAIMLLNQQGLLDIDDTIVSNIPGTANPYVPATAQYDIPNKASITIRQLLSHIAGVFDVTNEYVPSTCSVAYAGQNYIQYQEAIDPAYQFSPGEMIGVDATCNLSYFTPGADWKYSNTGYSILATIIERVSGLAYDQFVIQNLITPNGLTSTSVPMLGTDQTIPPPFNQGYVWEDGVWEDTTVSNMSANIGEGNIISTPCDLARWIKRLIKGQAGPNVSSVAAMETATPQSIAHGANYGLGMIYEQGLGYGHNGAHAGYLSLMLYDPASDVTVIVYMNVWDFANLTTAELPLLSSAALDARAAVGY